MTTRRSLLFPILAGVFLLAAAWSSHALAMWSFDWFEPDPSVWLFPDPPAEDCCGTWFGGGGCQSSPAISDCVCSFDDFCCDTAWDSICVDEAQDYCGYECGGGEDQGSCCSVVTDTPWCEPEMNECVCAFRPSCCAVSWDKTCVAIANNMCAYACYDLDGPGEGAPEPAPDSPCDFEPDGC